MDEDRIIRRMVDILQKHPGEWLTFGRLSWLVAIPECDADIIAAIAEYRHDLFALSDDRRLKLRTGAVEDVARQGISNWRVPPRPEQARAAETFRGAASAEPAQGVCYCESADQDVLRDLVEDSVPDKALVYSCCWRTICRVRGLFFNQVPEETWRELCRRRGYLRERENPRGF